MIISDLTEHFAPNIEDDMGAMDQELGNFRRRMNESLEIMILRYEQLRARQLDEGREIFTWRHHSTVMIQQCHLPPNSLHEVLYHLDPPGRAPDTKRGYEVLIRTLRARARLYEDNMQNPLRGMLASAQPDNRSRARPRKFFGDGYFAQPDEQGFLANGGATSSAEPAPVVSSYVEPTPQQSMPSYVSDAASSFPVEQGRPSGDSPTSGGMDLGPDAYIDVDGPGYDEMTTYMTAGELYEDGGESSSATSSDYGGDDIDPKEGGTEAERIFFQYRRAKRAWRRHFAGGTRPCRQLIC